MPRIHRKTLHLPSTLPHLLAVLRLNRQPIQRRLAHAISHRYRGRHLPRCRQGERPSGRRDIDDLWVREGGGTEEGEEGVGRGVDGDDIGVECRGEVGA